MWWLFLWCDDLLCCNAMDGAHRTQSACWRWAQVNSYVLHSRLLEMSTSILVIHYRGGTIWHNNGRANYCCIAARDIRTSAAGAPIQFDQPTPFVLSPRPWRHPSLREFRPHKNLEQQHRFLVRITFIPQGCKSVKSQPWTHQKAPPQTRYMVVAPEQQQTSDEVHTGTAADLRRGTYEYECMAQLEQQRMLRPAANHFRSSFPVDWGLFLLIIFRRNVPLAVTAKQRAIYSLRYSFTS